MLLHGCLGGNKSTTPSSLISFLTSALRPTPSISIRSYLQSTMFFGGDPFEHFAGMHGGGGSRRGGGGGVRGGPQADVDTTKLYETLGVSKINVVYYMCFLFGLVRNIIREQRDRDDMGCLLK